MFVDWTTGHHCEHCRPGSFGSALAGHGGCIPCECNGHGDSLRGYCHNQTGQCYCTHNTQGPHCESCLPGYYGDPRNNGTCYRQCQGRSVLLSSTTSTTIPLSSSLGWRSGTEGREGLSHCLWVLSVTENLGPCLPRQTCPPVALTLHPDSHTHCKVSANRTKHLQQTCCKSCHHACVCVFYSLRAPLSMCLMGSLVSWPMELCILMTI